MEDKSFIELGRLAQKGDKNAMAEIISKRFRKIYKECHGDEDEIQFVIEKMIIGIKNYKFF